MDRPLFSAETTKAWILAHHLIASDLAAGWPDGLVSTAIKEGN